MWSLMGSGTWFDKENIFITFLTSFNMKFVFCGRNVLHYLYVLTRTIFVDWC